MAIFDNLYQAKIDPLFNKPYETKELFSDINKSIENANTYGATIKPDSVLNPDAQKSYDLHKAAYDTLTKTAEAEGMHFRDKELATKKLAHAYANDPNRLAQLKSVAEREAEAKALEENKSLIPKFRQFALERSDDLFDRTGGSKVDEQKRSKTYSATKFTPANYVADQDIIKDLKFVDRGYEGGKSSISVPDATGAYTTTTFESGNKGVKIARVQDAAGSMWNENWKGIQDSHKQEVLIDEASARVGTKGFEGLNRSQIADVLTNTPEGQEILKQGIIRKRQTFIDNTSRQLAGEIITDKSKTDLGFVPGSADKNKPGLPTEVNPNLAVPAVRNSDGSVQFDTNWWGQITKTPEKYSGGQRLAEFDKTREEIAQQGGLLGFVGTGVTGIARPFLWAGSKAEDFIDFTLHKLGVEGEKVDKNGDEYKRAERLARRQNPDFDTLPEDRKEEEVISAGQRWTEQVWNSTQLTLTPSPDALKQNESETKIMFGDNADIKSGLQQSKSTIKNWTVSGETSLRTPGQLGEIIKEGTQPQYQGINLDPFSPYEYGSKNFAFTDTDGKDRIATGSPSINDRVSMTEVPFAGTTIKVSPYLVNRIYNQMYYQDYGKGNIDFYRGKTPAQAKIDYDGNGALHIKVGENSERVPRTYNGHELSEKDRAVYAAYLLSEKL